MQAYAIDTDQIFLTAAVSLSIISIMAVLIFEWRLRTLSSLIWMVLAVVFYGPLLKDVVFGNDRWPNYIYMEAALFSMGFNAFYLLGRFMLAHGNPRLYPLHIPPAPARKKESLSTGLTEAYLLSVILASGVLVWLYGLWSAEIPILNSTWTNFRDLPRWIAVLGNSLTLIGAVSVSAFFYYKRTLPGVIGLVAILSIALIVRTRVLLLPLFVPFMLLLLLFRPGIKMKLVGVLLGVLLFTSVTAVQVLRYGGSFVQVMDEPLSAQLERYELAQQREAGTSEFSRIDAFYYFLYHNNQFEYFGEGRQYIRIILLPFPSSIINYWGEIKPDDFALDMWHAYKQNWGNTGGTMHPLLYGEAYANLGMPGVILGSFWALVAYVMDILFSQAPGGQKICLLPILGGGYAIIARGATYSGVFLLGTGVVTLWGVRAVVRLLRKRPPHPLASPSDMPQLSSAGPSSPLQ